MLDDELQHTEETTATTRSLLNLARRFILPTSEQVKAYFDSVASDWDRMRQS